MHDCLPFRPWINFSGWQFRVHFVLTILYAIIALALCLLYPEATAGGYYVIGLELHGETILCPFVLALDLFWIIGILLLAPRSRRAEGDPRRTQPPQRIRYWRYWQWWAEAAAALVLAAGLLLLTLSADLPIPIWLYFYPRAGCCFLWWFTCAVEYGSDPRRRKKEASP